MITVLILTEAYAKKRLKVKSYCTAEPIYAQVLVANSRSSPRPAGVEEEDGVLQGRSLWQEGGIGFRARRQVEGAPGEPGTEQGRQLHKRVKKKSGGKKKKEGKKDKKKHPHPYHRRQR